MVFEEIFGSFPQTDSGQTVTEPRFEQIPDHPNNVLTGWIEALKFLGVLVQMLVIKAVQHFFLDNLHQLSQVHDHPGLGSDSTADRDFELIVMAVAVQVIALAENGSVFFLGQRSAVEAVGRAKAKGLG